MKNPKIKTKVVHSQTKSAWNVIGENLGGKYKIARVPYVCVENENVTDRNRIEAFEHATFISYCFNLSDANNVLADSAVRDALSTILRVGASMLTTGISGEISEWDLPKTTPLKTKRKILQEADKWNDVNRRRAIELKNAYDVLSRHFR